MTDPSKASYKTADLSELSTPPINKFYYDNDAISIIGHRKGDHNSGGYGQSSYGHSGYGHSGYGN